MKTFLLILGALVVLLLAAKLLLLVVPLAIALVLLLVPAALVVCALYSCMNSNKPANTKLLWILIIILAPVLGAVLWFLWGRQNT